MRKWLLHGVSWIVFFLMWDRIMYFYVNNELNRLYFSALDVSLVMAAFYGLYAYLVPRYLRDKDLVRLIYLGLLWCGLLTALDAWLMGMALNYMLVPIRFDFSWTYKDLQYNRIFIALLGVLVGGLIKLTLDRFALRRNLAVMELNYLKAQLNPHFLFNSLNSLYAQLEVHSGDPKQTLAAISDMLRYQLYDCNADLIALAKELDYLQNYIELQKLRNDRVSVNFVQPDQTSGLCIAPLILIPFVENAFKHISDRNDNRIDIYLGINERQIVFQCSNTSEPQPGPPGIGLANVRQRLEIMYGSAARLVVHDDGAVYDIKLTIPLRRC